MRRSLRLLGGVAGAVFLLDRWTKHWALESLAFNQPVPVLGEVLRLTYTRNSGVAFGIGQGTGFPYYVFSIAAAVVILTLYWRHRIMPLSRQLALSFILGGAVGNLVDRITSGEVVDFIEIGVSRWHWPVFNVADMAVTCGVVLFALGWTRAEAAPPASATGAAAYPASPHDLSHPDPGAGDAGGGAAGPLPGGRAGGPVP